MINDVNQLMSHGIGGHSFFRQCLLNFVPFRPIKIMSHSPERLLSLIQQQNTKLHLLVNSCLQSRQRHHLQDHSQQQSDSDLSRHEAKSDRHNYRNPPHYSRRMHKPRSIGEIDIGEMEGQHGGDKGLKYRSMPKRQKIDNYMQEKFTQLHHRHKQPSLLPQTDKPQRKDNIFRIKQHHDSHSHRDPNPEAVPAPPPALELKDIESINLHQLLSHLQSLTPPQLHSPTSHIIGYFESIHALLDVLLPSLPTIKKYQAAIYYGPKLSNPSLPCPAMLHYFNSTFYYGMLQGGKKQGLGVEVLVEQRQVWKGKYQQGQRTGYFYHSTPTSKYYGMVAKGNYHGQGHLLDTQSEYKGTFNQGVKEGKGWEKFRDKREYKGQYFQGRFDGQGQLKAPNYYYKGMWKEGRPDGSGFERTEEYQYLGEFEMGRKEGKGTIKTKQGSSMEGYFSRGLLVRQGGGRCKLLSPYLSKDLQQLHQQSEQGTIENIIRQIKSYPIQQKATSYQK